LNNHFTLHDDTDSPYSAWLSYLANKETESNSEFPKRGLSNTFVPGMNTVSLKKRNPPDNGVWIWMPAQGYISVPQQQSEGGNGAGSGKLMRYGRK